MEKNISKNSPNTLNSAADGSVGVVDESLVEVIDAIIKIIKAFDKLDKERRAEAIHHFEQLLHMLLPDDE